LINPAHAYEIQQATTGNPSVAVDLKFTQSSWNLTPSTRPSVDPAAAFGQTVYTVATTDQAATSPNSNTLVLKNIARSDINILLSGDDADAFIHQWDATQGTISLILRSDATGVAHADQAQRINTAKALAQGLTGYNYKVTLKVTADVLGTTSTEDDLSSQQDLVLTVRDVTRPVIALKEGVTTPTLVVKAIEGVLKPSTTSTAPTVGKGAATSTSGFLDVSGLATASNDLDVRYKVHMVLKNKSPGSTQSVDLTIDNFNPVDPLVIQLSDSQMKALGDGNVAIITTIVAKDLAGNTSTPFTLNSDEKTIAFKLDTTALAPTVTLVGDVVTYQGTTKVHTSATRQVQLRDLEVGSQVSYAVDNGAVVDLPPLMGTNTSATLDLPTLGNGPHTIQVTQTDAVGNQSIATTLAFNLALDVPTGVDGEITQFALLDPATQVSTEADPRLFWVNDKELPTLSGVVRGTLGANKLVWRVTNAAGVAGSWNTITLTDAQKTTLQETGQLTWHVMPSSLATGAGLLSLGLRNVYGQTNILSTRAYVYQDDLALPEPVVSWLNAFESSTTTHTATATPTVKVTGLKPHAIAQYQWLTGNDAAELQQTDWSTTLSRPATEGTHYLFVRQADVLTGKASAPTQALGIDLVTSGPNTIPAEGLYYEPIDGLMPTATTITRTLLADPTTSGDMGDLHPGRTVVVNNTWLKADVGGTLFLRWGNVLKTHTITQEDFNTSKIFVELTPEEILNQPGRTTVQAWTTDLLGHTSSVTSRVFTVDPAWVAGTLTSVNPVEAAAPQVAEWTTRSSVSS
ncbi:MAG: hypothetical protein ACO21V_13270, partial [Limnohabitans sp.]